MKYLNHIDHTFHNAQHENNHSNTTYNILHRAKLISEPA